MAPREDMQKSGSEEFPKIQSSRYRVLGILGSGAVGTVYKAEDTTLSKIVAIKLLRRAAADTEAMRFQREAKLAGSLSHPNILNVVDFGITDKHEPYLVLGYVQGRTLAERLEQANEVDPAEALDLTEAIDIFIQIARGLKHAHRNNVIHRDIKPTNIMLVDEPSSAAERVKIVDFGLAKSELDRQELTKAGVGLGTPLYMSPEQTSGVEVDARSDIYSFGCLMYEVLTGSPPFTADSVFELMEMKLDSGDIHVIENARFPIPLLLERIVNRCMVPNVDNRYQTADDLLRDLEQLRAEHLNSAAITSEDSAAPKAVAGIDWRPVAGIFIILLLATLPLVAFWAMFMQPEKEVKEKKRVSIEKTLRRGFEVTGPTDDDLRTFLFGQEGKTIQEIRFIDSKVTLKGYEQLIPYDVRAITLKGGIIDADILKTIAKIKSLDTIRLDQNDSIDPNAFVQLAKMPRLREFNLLAQTNISAVHIDAITVMPKLDRIVVHATDCDIHGGFKRWNKLPNLKTVMVDETDVDDNDIADLVDIPIQRLTMDMTGISGRTIDNLVQMKQLKIVSFVKAENVSADDYNRLRKLRPDLEIKWKFLKDTAPLPMPLGEI